MAFVLPKPYHLYCSVPSDDKPGELYTFRVGNYNAFEDLAPAIERDKAAMRNTFGGLIEPGRTHARTYRAFRAEWTEVHPVTGKGKLKAR